MFGHVWQGTKNILSQTVGLKMRILKLAMEGNAKDFHEVPDHRFQPVEFRSEAILSSLRTIDQSEMTGPFI